jgi:flagellar motor switch protein FliG
MTKAKEASMRRIAIVLASLPEPVAQRLLGSLQADSQRQVRAAINSLADVDPLERRRALDGFALSLRQGNSNTSTSSDAAELVFSRNAVEGLSERSSSVSSEKSKPLDFLKDVDDDELLLHLTGELPQTLAIILASISPSQAARVLPRLDVHVRLEAMRRMANLQEIPTELVDDIGNQLRRRLIPKGGTTAAGRRALDAILAEVPQAQPAATVTDNAQQTGESKAVGDKGNEPNAIPNATIPNKTSPHDSVTMPRLAKHTVVPREQEPPFDSTESIHAALTELPIDRLRDALSRVETRQALLTLCGLSSSTTEAVLSTLPRRQAKQVREQLASLGSLQLREIDEAKEAVARQAFQKVAGPNKERLAVAA